MGTSGRAHRWIASGAAMLVLACGDGESMGPFVAHRSRYFVYHERLTTPLCPTLLSRLDEHVELVGAKIGLELDEDEPFAYFRFEDQADFEDFSRCDVPSGLRGCARDDAALSIEPMHAHELVHAYVFRAWGRHSVGLLAEGVAAALSCEPFFPLQPGQTASDVLADPLDWRELLHIRGDTSFGYGAAGFFVTHLAETHGWSSVEELYRRVPPNADAGTFASVFAELYPSTIDELWSFALESPGRPSCQKDWPCVTTSLEPGSVAAPDCDGYYHRRIELGESGGVVLALGGTNAALRLLDCSSPAPSVYEFAAGQGTPGGIRWASMPMGSYTMFRSAIELPESVEFRARLAPDWIGGTCPDAGVVTLDPSGETSIDLPMGAVPFDGPRSEDGTAWIRLDGGSREYGVSSIDLAWSGLRPEASVELCDSCDASACTPLTRDGALRISISDTAALRMRQAASLPPPSEAWSHVFFHPVAE